MRRFNLFFTTLLATSLFVPLSNAQLLKTQVTDTLKATDLTLKQVTTEPAPTYKALDVNTIDKLGDIKLAQPVTDSPIAVQPKTVIDSSIVKEIGDINNTTPATDSPVLAKPALTPKAIAPAPTGDIPVIRDRLGDTKITPTATDSPVPTALTPTPKAIAPAPTGDNPVIRDRIGDIKTTPTATDSLVPKALTPTPRTIDPRTIDPDILESLGDIKTLPKTLPGPTDGKPLISINPSPIEEQPVEPTTTASCETTENICVIDQDGKAVCAFDNGTSLYKTFQYKHQAVDLSAAPNLPHLYIATANNDIYLENDEDDTSTPVVAATDIDTEHKIIGLHAFDDGLLILTEKIDASVSNVYFYNAAKKTIKVIQASYDNGAIDIASNTFDWERTYALLHRDGSVHLYQADNNRTIPSGSKSPVYFDAIQNGNGFHTIDLKNNHLIGSSRSSSDTIGELGVLVDVATDAQSTNVFLASETTVSKIPTLEGAPYQYDDTTLETFSFLDVTDIQQLEVAHLCAIVETPVEETPVEETPVEETPVAEETAEEEAHCTEYAYSGLNVVWNTDTEQCECVDYEYTITNDDGSITCTNDSEDTFAPETSEQESETIIEEDSQVVSTPWSGMVSGGCSGSSLIGFGPQHSMISLWQFFMIGFGPLATLIACRIRKNSLK